MTGARLEFPLKDKKLKKQMIVSHLLARKPTCLRDTHCVNAEFVLSFQSHRSSPLLQ